MSLSTSTVPDTFTIKGENLVRDLVIDLEGETGFLFSGSGEPIGHAVILHAEPVDGFIDLYVRSVESGNALHVEGNLGKDYNIVG